MFLRFHNISNKDNNTHKTLEQFFFFLEIDNNDDIFHDD